MGNNKEIRQRMNSYRSILLAINWILVAIVSIAALVLDHEWHLGGVGFLIVLLCVVFGVIGHFLINVGLAIPFILLNNGDIMKKILQKDNAISFDYVVSRDVNLRSDPNFDSKILTELKNGDEVLFLEKGEETTSGGVVTAPWFKVKNEDEIIGWCISSSLSKK